MIADACEGCAKPDGGLYIMGCRACSLRSIARGMEFYESTKAGKLTQAYRSRLVVLGEVKMVHAEVKAAAGGSLL